MNKRIKELRGCLELTQAEFAEKINLSRNFIALVESQGRTISERTVLDICRVFSVNRRWLETGEGDMFQKERREEQMTDFFAKVLKDKPDSFRYQLILALSKLDEEDWKVCAEIAKKALAEQQEREKAGE